MVAVERTNGSIYLQHRSAFRLHYVIYLVGQRDK